MSTLSREESLRTLTTDLPLHPVRAVSQAAEHPTLVPNAHLSPTRDAAQIDGYGGARVAYPILDCDREANLSTSRIGNR
jgi:hypothetical protein